MSVAEILYSGAREGDADNVRQREPCSPFRDGHGKMTCGALRDRSRRGRRLRVHGRPEDAPGRRRPVFRISLLAAMAKESFALTWWLGR